MADFLVTQAGNEVSWYEGETIEEVQELVAQDFGYDTYEEYLEEMEELGLEDDFNVILM